jgi:heptosyltransferase II
MNLPTDGILTLVSTPTAPQLATGIFARPPSTIIYGAFKAMGDLLNASSVIASQLDFGHKIRLLLFPSTALQEFVQLVDFGPNRGNLELLPLPVSGTVGAFGDYFSRAKAIDPVLIWISPHSPHSASSWKIPLLLWFTKRFFWQKASLAGAVSEPLSWLFGERVSVDRDLPYMEREHLAFSMLSGSSGTVPMRPIAFIPRIQEQRKSPSLYDLLIHPGASVPSRMWPCNRYAELMPFLPPHIRIAVVGVPNDVESMRRTLPANHAITFLSGNLEQAISAIARSRVVLTMDSGAMHFAKVLNVPTVALFGKCDPATVIAVGTSVLPIYERNFPCQPCGKSGCSQAQAYCINSIEAVTVARALLRLLDPTTQPNFQGPG